MGATVVESEGCSCPGADRGVPAPQLMFFVEVIQFSCVTVWNQGYVLRTRTAQRGWLKAVSPDSRSDSQQLESLFCRILRPFSDSFHLDVESQRSSHFLGSPRWPTVVWSSRARGCSDLHRRVEFVAIHMPPRHHATHATQPPPPPQPTIP